MDTLTISFLDGYEHTYLGPPLVNAWGLRLISYYIDCAGANPGDILRVNLHSEFWGSLAKTYIFQQSTQSEVSMKGIQIVVPPSSSSAQQVFLQQPIPVCHDMKPHHLSNLTASIQLPSGSFVTASNQGAGHPCLVLHFEIVRAGLATFYWDPTKVASGMQMQSLP